MSRQPSHPVSPQFPNSPPSSSTVRRVHTISAASRAARTQSRIALSEDAEQAWGEDDVVDQDWEGGAGVVGEKNSSLHRQASLPARYNRPFQRSGSIRQGTVTPRTINSLASIQAENDHEAQEEEWENDVRDWRDDDERSIPSPDASIGHGSIGHGDSRSQGSSQAHSPLSPHFSQIHNISGSPPPGANIRRHQSLTYGAQGGVRRINPNLKRSGTLQAQIERPGTSTETPSPPDNNEELFEEGLSPDEENIYLPKQASMNQSPSYLQTSFGRDGSLWKTQDSDWRTIAANGLGTPNHGVAIDDVQRALSSLELSSDSQSHYVSNANYELSRGSTPSYPPRFNYGQSQPQAPVMRRERHGNNNNNNNNGDNHPQTNRSSTVQLGGDIDNNKNYNLSNVSGILTPIGHSMPTQLSSSQRNIRDREGMYAASSAWDQKDRMLNTGSSNSSMQYNTGYSGEIGLPSTSPVHFLPQGASAPRLGVNTNFVQNSQNSNQNVISLGNAQQGLSFLASPIDVPSLIASKGYNPTQFDIQPPFARYFVIKSYTEDDVHKSLKYEIWSSTDPGNKRLDKAFKETANRGPIYLFFSVNASGHFCGMAEMLTPVDYTRSSTVWASDKWKGVFKVRWIFVRDIPNANLRHIKLNNTQERKPVTNSRDTQELLPEAGQEMLRIFFTHPARTSLLQDFAYYEMQSLKKLQQGSTSPLQTPLNLQNPPSQLPSQSPQHSFSNLGNQNSLPYSTQPLQLPIGTMMQMQLNPQYSHPATVQSVMRNTSPIPAANGYMNLNTGF